MEINIVEYSVTPGRRKLYGVFVDDKEVEALVTHDATMVKSWIATVEHVNRCWLHCLIVGLDVQCHPAFMDDHYPPVATLQLCVGEYCLIFQILHAARIPCELREFLEEPDYTFVGVGIKNDVEKLWNDYGLEVGKTQDLRSWAAMELEKEELRGVGLKMLVREVLGKDVKKQKNVTLSRWDKEFRTMKQIVYAFLDAYFSFEVGRNLSAWY